MERFRDTKRIVFRSGFKHQTLERITILVAIKPKESVRNHFIRLTTKGVLTIERGYAWDGPSGPAIATRTFWRGSVVHDALYQLCRENPFLATLGNWRELADNELWRICREDGMWKIRAWYVRKAVRIAGKRAAKPSSRRRTRYAP